MGIREAYRTLPGKAGERDTHLPLWMHLEDTAAVMDYLCKRRIAASVLRAAGLDKETFCRVGNFLARVHDMGKCTPRFAARILTVMPNRREVLHRCGADLPQQAEFSTEENLPHALAGELLLRHFGCPDGISAVVGAHHGKPSAGMEETYRADARIDAKPLSFYAKRKELWQGMQERLLQEALDKSGYSSTAELPKLSHCAQMLLCGLLIQADWIASNEKYFPLLAAEDEGTMAMYPDRVRQALERLSLPEPWRACIGEIDDKEFFLRRFGFSPNAVQREAISLARGASEAGGLMIIEAQMGVGKTEAALAAAEILAEKSGCGGLFFGLPTQATSNGLFPRMIQWADRVSQDSTHAVRLVHGMAELNEDYRQLFRGRATVEEDGEHSDRLTVHSWFSGKKQALLADFVVGTVDTALMAALKQKHIMLRHLGLCGKVVVIDECHAYDAYMSRFLICMLQWLGAYQVPTILLSATLPEEKRREMIQAYCMPYAGEKKRKKFPVPSAEGYPLLTWAAGEKLRCVSAAEAASATTVAIESIEEETLAKTLCTRLSEGGCAGVIVNTVRRAQEIADQLRRQLPNETVYVCHAQFIAQDRIRREKELLSMIGKASAPEQRNHVIVVGTQVLEQSLDIDFDYLVTDLCPMDLLLQRMGRLHRHARPRPVPLSHPVCTVLGTGDEYNRGSVKIYGEWLLKRTRRYLPQEVCLPQDIPALVNRVYAQPEEAERDKTWEKFHDRTEIKEDKADAWCLGHPKASERESMNSIVGLLDNSAIDSDKKAEASVRDGASSVDVLVMCRKDEDHIGFLPWLSNQLLRMDSTPSEEEARTIALQKLRLPFILGVGENLNAVLTTLEQENQRWLSPWQESPWLRGELILLLDKNGERDLCGYHLRYEKENGLRYERIGE